MISLSASSRIYVYAAVTDMRKSINGLSALVEDHFTGELLSGSFFVFCNRHRNRVKIIYWDNDGFAIWYKRLEKGKFRICQVGSHYMVDRKELMLLLEGVAPLHYDKRFLIKS